MEVEGVVEVAGEMEWAAVVVAEEEIEREREVFVLMEMEVAGLRRREEGGRVSEGRNLRREWRWLSDRNELVAIGDRKKEQEKGLKVLGSSSR